LKLLDHLEAFLQVKSLFLLLQVLYDLRQSEPALPIINLLELKLHDFQYIIMQKRLCKDPFTQESFSTTTTAHSTDKHEEESKEANTWNSDMPILEELDETVVSRNSFVIIVGAYLRKHAVSPKNVNLKEYQLLLNAFKALFKLMQKDLKGAQECFDKARQNKQNFSSDATQLVPTLLKPA
jgi:hypothetical protein